MADFGSDWKWWHWVAFIALFVFTLPLALWRAWGGNE